MVLIALDPNFNLTVYHGMSCYVVCFDYKLLFNILNKHNCY